MSPWLLALIALGVALWITYWGWGTAYIAARARQKYCDRNENVLVKPVWFVLGAILGPIGPLLAIPLYRGIVSLDYREARWAGADAVRTLMNPLKWRPERQTGRRLKAVAHVRSCHLCSRSIEPFEMAGGAFAGTVADLAALPKIGPNHGLVCDKCRKVSCPECSGRKARERQVRAFLCTACGHGPLTAIYRG